MPKLGVVAHTCNPSIWKPEKGGRLSLGSTGARVRPYLKKLRKRGREGERKKEKEEGGRRGEGRRRRGFSIGMWPERTESWACSSTAQTNNIYFSNISLTKFYFFFLFKTLIGQVKSEQHEGKHKLHVGTSTMIWDHNFCLAES